MAQRVYDWLDQYGKITFHYRDENWSVVDRDGPGMIFQKQGLLIDIPLGQYPRPDFTEQVLNDFYRCNPGNPTGKWKWSDHKWLLTAHMNG